MGRTVVLGIRPEDLEDAALAPTRPRTGACAASVDAARGARVRDHRALRDRTRRPSLTEDTKELAEDIGTGHHYEAHAEATVATVQARRPLRRPHRRRARARPVEVAVDTRALALLRPRDRVSASTTAAADREQPARAAARDRTPDRKELTLMSRTTWIIIAVVVALAASSASPSSRTATTTITSRRRGDDRVRRRRDVSGNVSVMAVWTGDEQESFQAVIDGVQREVPRRHRQLHVGRRPAADRALDRRRGRQPAGRRGRRRSRGS